MGQIADRAMAFVDENIEETLELVGDASTEYIRQSISEPYPPASSPNNPPHARTYLLVAGVHFVVDKSDQKVTIISGRVDTGDGGMVPTWLEFGTVKMAPRPYMTPAMDDTYKICEHAVNFGMAADHTFAAAQTFAFSGKGI